MSRCSDRPVAVNDDHAIASRIATDAGHLLLELRQTAARTGMTVDELRAEGDLRSNRFILDALAQARPGDAVLSEEAVDDKVRLTAARVWIVDPLDGTREYGEDGRTDWAVHVALQEGDTLTVGAVPLPALGVTLSTAPGQTPPVPPPVS